jgi:hypothetical protein
MWGQFRVSDHALAARAAALAHRCGSKLFVAQLRTERRLRDGMVAMATTSRTVDRPTGWGYKTARDLREGQKTKHV